MPSTSSRQALSDETLANLLFVFLLPALLLKRLARFLCRDLPGRLVSHLTPFRPRILLSGEAPGVRLPLDPRVSTNGGRWPSGGRISSQRRARYRCWSRSDNTAVMSRRASATTSRRHQLDVAPEPIRRPGAMESGNLPEVPSPSGESSPQRSDGLTSARHGPYRARASRETLPAHVEPGPQAPPR